MLPCLLLFLPQLDLPGTVWHTGVYSWMTLKQFGWQLKLTTTVRSPADHHHHTLGCLMVNFLLELTVNPSSFGSLCISIEPENSRLKSIQQEPVIFLVFIRKHNGPKQSHTRFPPVLCFPHCNSKEMPRVGCGTQPPISRVIMLAIVIFHGGKWVSFPFTLSQFWLHTTQWWEGVRCGEGRNSLEVYWLSGVENDGLHGHWCSTSKNSKFLK